MSPRHNWPKAKPQKPKDAPKPTPTHRPLAEIRRDLATLGTVAGHPSDDIMLGSAVQCVGLTTSGAFTGTLHIYVE